uniref:Legume lectin domain-containing protein n=1 Tax=Solanum lycopersicum TaxID=4081 RepID=A0A3Q7IG43_SOLLC
MEEIIVLMKLFAHHFVVVEFDIYTNYYDTRGDHVGIDVNSMQSYATVNCTYNSIAKNISVVFTGFKKQVNTTVTILFGFTGATRNFIEIHIIYSWNFTSSFKYNDNIKHPDVPLPSPVPEDSLSKNKSRLVIRLITSRCVSIVVSIFIVFIIDGSLTYEFERST